MKKETMNERDDKLRPYLEALPDIFRYRIATGLILEVWLFLLGRLFRVVLNSTGRVAVTSGDFMFLFTSWQGVAIILLALISLSVYVALDLDAKIILSRNMLLGKSQTFWQTIQEALRCIPRLFNIKGIGIILYIVLIAPLLGIGFSVSLTRGFYIPTFISSVVADTPLYLALAIITVLVFMFVGVANLFIMHGIVLDRIAVKEAGDQSKAIMRQNWKDYLWQNIAFILVMAAVLVIVTAAVLILPMALLNILPLSEKFRQGLVLYFMIQGVILSLLAVLAATPLYIMKMTQLYYKYSTGEDVHYQPRQVTVYKSDKLALAAVLTGVVALSVFLNNSFDRFFPIASKVKVIAHRAGGVEGPENTVAGLKKARTLGVFGSEIDIQRTKDGCYIINHDGNFSRVAGDDHKPEELTLAQIRQLSVDGEPVATFEEMLDASKGKVVLFIELKGATADHQMADDAVRIVKERGMEKEVVLISLDYELIDYIEKKYPEMDTGFLTFASFGDTALLNCDYLGLEEESATNDTITAIHKQGKKVLVWTVNKEGSQRHFMCSAADGIITDCVVQANGMFEKLQKRSAVSRIVDKIRVIMG